jgi:predicted phage tail protein
MSKTVIVTLETVATPFPAGTVAAGIVITLSGGAAPSQTIAAAPYTASFAGVAPGTYTATAEAVDASGQPLGSAIVSAEFTIEADPTVNVDVPSTISVVIQ